MSTLFHAFQIGGRIDGFLHGDTLQRPCDGVQQQHFLISQFFPQRRLLSFVQLGRILVTFGKKWQEVDAKNLLFVLIVGQQGSAKLSLLTLHGTVDFWRFRQRRFRVHRDF